MENLKDRLEALSDCELTSLCDQADNLDSLTYNKLSESEKKELDEYQLELERR